MAAVEPVEEDAVLVVEDVEGVHEEGVGVAEAGDAAAGVDLRGAAQGVLLGRAVEGRHRAAGAEGQALPGACGGELVGHRHGGDVDGVQGRRARPAAPQRAGRVEGQVAEVVAGVVQIAQVRGRAGGQVDPEQAGAPDVGAVGGAGRVDGDGRHLIQGRAADRRDAGGGARGLVDGVELVVARGVQHARLRMDEDAAEVPVEARAAHHDPGSAVLVDPEGPVRVAVVVAVDRVEVVPVPGQPAEEGLLAGDAHRALEAARRRIDGQQARIGGVAEGVEHLLGRRPAGHHQRGADREGGAQGRLAHGGSSLSRDSGMQLP